MTPEQMAALDERPVRRFTPGGVVSMEYAEHRSRVRPGCRCGRQHRTDLPAVRREGARDRTVAERRVRPARRA